MQWTQPREPSDRLDAPRGRWGPSRGSRYLIARRAGMMAAKNVAATLPRICKSIAPARQRTRARLSSCHYQSISTGACHSARSCRSELEAQESKPFDEARREVTR